MKRLLLGSSGAGCLFVDVSQCLCVGLSTQLLAVYPYSMQDRQHLSRRCLIVLYFIGADKETLQAEIVAAGAVPHVIKLCSSSDAALQAEAADLLKVRSAVLDAHPGCFLWGCMHDMSLRMFTYTL